MIRVRSLVPVLLCQGWCAAAVLTVGPGGDFPTLGAAVSAAAANDVIEVAAGGYAEVVVLDKPLTILGVNAGISAGAVAGARGPETVVTGGIRIAAGADGAVVSGVRIEEGFEWEGSRAGMVIGAADATVRDSIITGVSGTGAYGLRAGAAASGLSVENSRITGNSAGILLAGVPQGELTANRIDGNTGNGCVAAGSVAIGFHGNLVEANGAAGLATSGANAGLIVRENRFTGNALAVANGGTDALDARWNFWNSGQSRPSENGPNGFSGDVAFSPWYADANLQVLVQAFDEDAVIGSGEELSVNVLLIGAGATLEVAGGKVSANRLDLSAGGTLHVIDGDLELGVPGGGTHKISGTFRISHSLGSIEILANTEFSGDTLGLVSDIHVADGVVLTVTGSLRLDGCRLLGAGTFTVVVNVGAQLELIRCEVRGGSFFIVGSDLRMVDNFFDSCSVTVFGTVVGADIYHNIFSGGPGDLAILPGAVVNTNVETWGNVQTLPETKNRLMLEWVAPTLPGRTLDPEGTLYVQPGDPAFLEIDSGGYFARIQAAELLLAYHSGYVALSGYQPRAPWDNSLYLLDQPLSLFGKVDAAAGFGFAHEDPDGTLNDYVIGDFQFDTQPVEGRTLVFFREPTAEDNPQIRTRLTTSNAGTPSYFNHPFTRNSGTLVIDGTAPDIEAATASVTQDQGSGPVDVLQAGVFTRIGDVDITFDAYDALAGVDPSAVSLVLDGPQVFSAALQGTSTVTLSGLDFTRYQFVFEVDAGTPDGVYDVIAIVTDRSGNTTQLLLGTLEIAKWIATISVQSQGLVSAPITRTVVFVMTDSLSQVLESRPVAVDFVGGTGTAVLTGIPGATAFISAKTQWTLRRRLPCVFDADNNAEVNFTGASLLRGGDLNGDNIVNLVDYNILNANWFTTSATADISGDGVVNVFDYNVLNSNWFTLGDPQ
jgi:nitrous oxidase accessory protein NosD